MTEKLQVQPMIYLESERLQFRDHELADLEAYCEMESDPIYRSPQTVRPREEIERGFQEGWMIPKPLGLRATVLRAENKYIGRCGIYASRDDAGEIVPGEAQLAYYLARPYWGRGLATEAGAAFVTYGFGNFGLKRITAGMNVLNVASVRVPEKLGFQWIQEGEGGGNRWYLYELRSPW